MGVFSNTVPMPFTAAKQLVIDVPTDGTTEGTLFSGSIAADSVTAQDLNADTALVFNDGLVTAYFQFTVGDQVGGDVVPGGSATSNDTLGQPILAGAILTVLVAPNMAALNASCDSGAGTTLRVSLGRGQ